MFVFCYKKLTDHDISKKRVPIFVVFFVFRVFILFCLDTIPYSIFEKRRQMFRHCSFLNFLSSALIRFACCVLLPYFFLFVLLFFIIVNIFFKTNYLNQVFLFLVPNFLNIQLLTYSSKFYFCAYRWLRNLCPHKPNNDQWQKFLIIFQKSYA